MEKRLRQLKSLVIFQVILLLVIAFAFLRRAERPLEPSPLPTTRPRVMIQQSVWLPRVSVLTNPKKGIGLTYGECLDVKHGGASWHFGWGPQPPDCEGSESVPMIWGMQTMGVPISGTSEHLQGCNEPDRSNQANMTPYEGAVFHHLMKLTYPEWKQVSCAVAHTGLDWLRQMVSEYENLYGELPQLEALAIHCYANSFQGCVDAVEEVKGMLTDWNIPGGIWVTEFSFWPTQTRSFTHTLAEARAFIDWMDAEPLVSRYAWFAARIQGDEWWAPNVASPLFDFESGDLTFYGEMYRSPSPQ